MFPANFRVGIHKHSVGAGDDYNPSTSVYTPPKNQPGTPAMAIGPAPVSSTEPPVAGHDRVIVELQLLVPPDFTVASRDLIDLIDLDGDQYEVIGEVEDWTKGPFVFAPGKVVNLKKAEG